jgi:translation initiation factor IF-1
MVAAVAVADTVAVATVTDPERTWNTRQREETEDPPRAICFPLALPFWLVCGVLPTVGTGRYPHYSMKEMPVQVEGVIHTVLPGTMFRVELDNRHLVLATISGKMRKRWVRLTVGDRVKMEMSPYDLDKARIIWRLQ